MNVGDIPMLSAHELAKALTDQADAKLPSIGTKVKYLDFDVLGYLNMKLSFVSFQNQMDPGLKKSK
jgi:hypothetical protein